MKKLKYYDRQILSAFVLGLSALAVNCLLLWIWPNTQIYAGNFFIFCSAIALGPWKTLIACAVAVIPEVIYREAAYNSGLLDACRLIFTAVVIAVAAQRRRDVPSFIIAALLWFLVFAPAYYFIGSGMQAAKIDFRALAFSGFVEILLVILSGAALLDRNFWYLVTYRPRQASLSTLVMHLLALLSSLSLFVALLSYPAPHISGFPGRFPVDVWTVLELTAFSLAAAAVVGHFFSVIITNNLQEYFSANLLSTRTQSFSGLSSDYWKRVKSRDSKSRSSSSEISRGDPPALDPAGGICALNRNGTVSFVNRKFCSLIEMREKEPLGKRLEALTFRPEVKECLLKLVEESFATKPKKIELKLNQLPDKLRYFEIVSQYAESLGHSALTDSPQGLILTIRDITDRRAVELHLLEGQRLVSLGNMVTGLAHSFNNVLTAIAGQASFAKRTADPQRIQDALGKIVSAAAQAGKLVRQLLSYAEGSPALFRKENFDQLIKQRLDLLRKLVGENIELVYHGPERALGTTCDANLITQVLTNLIINSKEALAGKQGRITISLKTEHLVQDVSDFITNARPGDFVRLRIEDNGCGMTPGVLAHACDPLFTTKGSRGNPGLGLSIVYGIVRAHDGFLTIESQSEKGTSVTIYFPSVTLDPAEADSAAQTPGAAPAAKRRGPYRILIVEDDESVREIVQTMLETLGYHAEACANGAAALEHCRTKHFDLILADMLMPQMTGKELFQRLREEGKSFKLAIMTAYGTAKESLEPGIALLQKPFDIDALARLINEAIEG